MARHLLGGLNTLIGDLVRSSTVSLVERLAAARTPELTARPVAYADGHAERATSRSCTGTLRVTIPHRRSNDCLVKDRPQWAVRQDVEACESGGGSA